MKAQRMEYSYSSTLSLTSALGGCGGSAPRPGRFTPVKDPVPIIGGWVGPRDGLVREMSLTPGFDLRTVQPVASRPELFFIIVATN